MRAPGVIARQTHCLHHRFGARHMERHFILASNRQQCCYIRCDRRMVGAQHRAELRGERTATRHAFLVKIIAKHIDAIGPGQVHTLIAVQIGQGDAGRGIGERAGVQVLAHMAAELKRHPITSGEIQIRDTIAYRPGQRDRLGVTRHEFGAQPFKGRLALRGNRGRGSIGTEELILAVLVIGHPFGRKPAHARMTGERSMLGTGQLKAGFHPWKNGGQCGRTKKIQGRV